MSEVNKSELSPLEQDNASLFKYIGPDMTLLIFTFIWPYGAEPRPTRRYFRNILNQNGRLYLKAAKMNNCKQSILFSDILKNTHLKYTEYDCGTYDRSININNSDFKNLRKNLTIYILNNIKIRHYYKNIQNDILQIDEFARKNSRFGLELNFQKIIPILDRNILGKRSYRDEFQGYQNLTYKDIKLNNGSLKEMFW